jgi:hypothetical protein
MKGVLLDAQTDLKRIAQQMRDRATFASTSKGLGTLLLQWAEVCDPAVQCEHEASYVKDIYVCESCGAVTGESIG